MICSTSISIASRNYAIVSWLYKEDGKQDDIVQKLIDDELFNPVTDTIKDFYSYTGSHTQPGCDKTANWYIVSDTGTIDST